MREIPSKMIQEIDILLGIKGRPYRRFAGGDWKSTSCYQWTTKTHPMEVASSWSPELAQAMVDVQRHMARRPALGSDPMKSMRRRFSKQFPELMDEFDAYIARLQEAQVQFLNPEGLEPPELPEALKGPAEQISQQIHAEMDLSDPDIDVYLQRLKELWDEQPEKIREKQGEFQQKVREYEEAVQRSSDRGRSRLRLVRRHLQDQPYTAYGDVIVAPTGNSYDILRIEGTNAANFGLQTEQVIDTLKYIDDRYGIDILDAGYDAVTFQLEKPPSGQEAEGFIDELYAFCPDLAVEERPKVDEPIQLWWD